MPAPRAILAAAIEGAYVDVDTADEIETLLRLAGHRSGRAEHDQGVLLRPAASTAVARGRRASTKYTPKKVGVIGAGMMGAAIAYVTAKAGIDVVLSDINIDAANGQGLLGPVAGEGSLARQDHRGEVQGAARAASPDRGRCRLRRRRLRDRGRVRVGRGQEQRCSRNPGTSSTPTPCWVQHLDAADHHPRRGRGSALRTSSASISSAPSTRCRWWRSSGCEDLRRRAGQGHRLHPGDPQDPDRRQRQPRVLHQPRHRYLHQRGHRGRWRGRRAGIDRAGRFAGRVPGSAAAADG